MGNTNQQNQVKLQNTIQIEFLTAQQKKEKAKTIDNLQKQELEESKDDDIVIILDYAKHYQVALRQFIRTDQDVISIEVPLFIPIYQQILNLIINPTEKTPTEFLKMQSFFTTEVRQFQVYVNDNEFGDKLQTYKFSESQGKQLQIEIVYIQKHWLERLIGKTRDFSQKLRRSLEVVANVITYALPLYGIFRSFQPYLMPSLKAANGLIKIPQVQAISSFLMGAIQHMTPMATSLIPRIFSPQGLGVTLCLFLGRNILWTFLKILILIFCPFLSPLFWIIGI